MAHKLADIVDIERLQRVCDGLAEATGIANAVIGPDGTVLVASGWQDICTQFHRRAETTAAGCLESDRRINERVHAALEAPRHIAYRCANGLWDVAFPLVIADEHVANVFTGQFFYDDDEIDVKTFRRRAHKVGFDEGAYLSALGRVPVVSHARAARTIDFLTDFVGMLGELGLAKLREEQTANALRASGEALEEAQAMASLGRWELDLVEDRLDWSPGIFEIFEIDPERFAASYEGFMALIHPDDRAAVDDAYAKSLKDRRPYDIVHRLLMKDGRVKWVHERCRTDYDADGVPLRSIGVIQDVTEQTAAEAALRESEERLRLANKATNDVIWDWDVVRDAQRWSPAGASVFGWTDIVDHPQPAAWWADRIHPDDRQRVDDGFFAVVNDPAMSAWQDDYRFRRADGSYAQVMDRGFVIRGSDGQAVRVIGTVLDMTERKQSEDALRHSEERFAKAFHGSPDAILVARADDGLITEVNEGFVELSGFTRDEAIGRTTLALGLWADPSERKRMLSAMQAEGSVRDLEFAFHTKAGGVLQCLLGGALIDLEGAPHLLVVVRDVTAQRNAEAAQERSEAVLRGVMENLQDAYVRTNLEGRFVMVSPSAARLYHFDTADEMIGLPSTSLYAEPADREELLARLRAHDQVTDFVALARRHDGTTFWVSLNAQYYRDADGSVAGVEGFVRDITERRHAEAEVARLNADLERRVVARTAQLEAANKELESFAYSISHDLRSPLRAVNGFSEILREDYGDRLDAEGLAHLDRISGAVHHMTDLMDGLLQLSRLNREGLDRREVDLGALAAEILQELRSRDAERTVEERIGRDLVADADPQLARIVLQNLLANAWKFTARHDTARIEVDAVRSTGGATFFVRDDGAGFDMRYADKLFGAFQRLHTPDQFEGTGIGLATVQRIIHRHGGSVWAEAEVEKGATFWFTLGAPGGD